MSETLRKNRDNLAKILVKVDGVLVPNFSVKDLSTEEHIGKVKEMEVRDDDVFILGYPKCVSYGCMIDYILDCEDVLAAHPDLPVLVRSFEVMKQAPVENVKEVAKFLGVDVSDDFCSAVADACSFHKLKKADSEIKVDPLKDAWKDGGSGMYRKGVVGDWKNWLTVAQNEEFDRIYKEKMKNSKLCLGYSHQ